MIFLIRRVVGLGDNFYYNNGIESINLFLKSEIEKLKNAFLFGKLFKCFYGEFVNIVSGFVSRYRRNIYRVVVGDGFYKLVFNYQYLVVIEDFWRSLSKKERVVKISVVDLVGFKKFYQVEMEGTSIVLFVLGFFQMEVLVFISDYFSLINFLDFDCSGFLEYFRGFWDKVQDIIGRNGVIKINENIMVVVLLINLRKLYIVNRVGLKLICDCERFKSEIFCGYVFAVFYQENVFFDVVVLWELKLLNFVSFLILKKVGKKLGFQ